MKKLLPMAKSSRMQPAVSLVLVALLATSAITLLALPSLSTRVPVVSAASSQMAISIDVGALHFPGENAVFAFTTIVNGILVTPGTLNVTLYLPNNVNSLTLTPTAIATGLYDVNYSLPSTCFVWILCTRR